MSDRLAETIARIGAPDDDAGREAQDLLDAKTKPRRSLGRLEELACRIAAIRGHARPDFEPAIVVVAADHGIAAEGVSAYPQEVTAQMVANFVAGGAAINVLARRAGARLVVVDAGVATPIAEGPVRALRLGAGTVSFASGPAMSRDQAVAGIVAGIELADELAADGVDLLGIGEMGIGNTTSASALAAVLLGVDAASVCGRGTGLDDDGLARKVETIRRALALQAPDTADPLGVLAAVGGFEIAVLAGLVLGAAANRLPVLLDGFITGAAALVAVRLAPAAAGSLIAAHRSPEPGHAPILAELGLDPLLDLGLRLGEGSGAALALPIVAASLAVLGEMATFESAGVSDAGR
ncbi:MAG: nicotinate-nucleotide--dimethylbenzimidazole phosphoribosyltransferase [Actinobacteria bacterium]|nr:MAG: nicotinate-nucleotide--dimethylbenzimidazole phosphoribosyltransferase [Actinomycetota bacterium]